MKSFFKITLFELDNNAVYYMIASSNILNKFMDYNLKVLDGVFILLQFIYFLFLREIPVRQPFFAFIYYNNLFKDLNYNALFNMYHLSIKNL